MIPESSVISKTCFVSNLQYVCLLLSKLIRQSEHMLSLLIPQLFFQCIMKGIRPICDQNWRDEILDVASKVWQIIRQMRM